MAGFLLDTRFEVEDGRLFVGRSQDCTPIAERAKRMHNEGQHGSSEMRLAADIPYVIAEKYCNDNGVTFAEFMSNPVHIKRVVMNPDNAMFRVWKGAI